MVRDQKEWEDFTTHTFKGVKGEGGIREFDLKILS